MSDLFSKLLAFNSNNKPCRIKKKDGIICYVKFIKDIKWVNEELKKEFTVTFISNTEEELELSSYGIQDILPIESE